MSDLTLFRDQETPQAPQNMQTSQLLVEDLMNLMTILYMVMQLALDDPIGFSSAMSNLRESVQQTFTGTRTDAAAGTLEPSLVEFWFHAVATKSRWDDSGAIPQTQVGAKS